MLKSPVCLFVVTWLRASIPTCSSPPNDFCCLWWRQWWNVPVSVRVSQKMWRFHKNFCCRGRQMHALMCSMLKRIRKKDEKMKLSQRFHRFDSTCPLWTVPFPLLLLLYRQFLTLSQLRWGFIFLLKSSGKLRKDEYIFKKNTCLKKGSMYVFYCLYLVYSCCPCCFCANVVGEISIWPLMQLFCEVLSKNVSTWNKHIWLFFLPNCWNCVLFSEGLKVLHNVFIIRLKAVHEYSTSVGKKWLLWATFCKWATPPHSQRGSYFTRNNPW